MAKFFLHIFLFISCLGQVFSQNTEALLAPGAKNPIFPGYFADPTIKKFGDIYYVYATTDDEMLASGAPTVWYSKDFQNWYNYTMEIPSLESVNLRNFWAPDIIEGNDGKYYLYFGNCQSGCNIYGYVSNTPVGPWEKLNEDDTPIIAHNYPIKGFPSLDAQFFKDVDGRVYVYWGTWVHYNNGFAVGELNTSTMKDVFNPKNIPLEQTPNPFEAAYMMKKGAKYILMYSGDSCHDETYNVRYSYADSPYGPFTPGENNSILSSSDDLSVHGPGHHSIFQDGDEYYIVYHRHNYPLKRGGLARQVSIDKMVFKNDSTIEKVIPTHNGIKPFSKSEVPNNIAYLSNSKASSFYHLKSLAYDYQYQPSFAVDDNNATMWKAADNSFPQNLEIDLGSVKKIERVLTQFEYASYYYQYKIEYSDTGKNWKIYVDKSSNQTSGSPMIDENSVFARYLRLTVLNTEKTGIFAAVWNIKVYSSLFEIPLRLTNSTSKNKPGSSSTKQVLVKIDAAKVSKNELQKVKNKGKLGGYLLKNGEVEIVQDSEGVKAFNFVKGALILDKPVPSSLAWNGSYTVAAWVKNPEISKEGECLASWCDRHEFNLANSYNALFYNSANYGAAAHLDGHFDMRYNKLPKANKWHHIVLTYDGVVEKIYVDGILDNSQNMTLASAIKNAKISIGASDIGENYSGLMASLNFYDYALCAKKINELMFTTNPKNK